MLMGRAKIGGKSTTGFGTSWDEGASFSIFADLNVAGPGSSFDEYDAMSLLPDGSIAVVAAHGDIHRPANVDYRNLFYEPQE